MTSEELIHLAARVLSCGIWVAASLYKATHIERTLEEMAHMGIPFRRVILPLVIVMELLGSFLIIIDRYVWLVALVWLVFLVPASWIYHFRFMVKDGTIDFPQFVTGWKNVSIAGGLFALILLDESRPAWLG
jgi:uncharacterized membrane protein YphA (DoxX/SURF4 family)